MVEEGDPAPDFIAPVANGEVEQFALVDQFPENAPIVLAFFPGAFTSVCSHEMNTFQDRLTEFQEHGATVLGVSTDLPFALNEFRDEIGVDFPMVSDDTGQIIDAYGVATGFDHIGLSDVAKRSVFVIDEEMTVTYAWVSDDPSIEPDYDEVLEAVAASATA